MAGQALGVGVVGGERALADAEPRVQEDGGGVGGIHALGAEVLAVAREAVLRAVQGEQCIGRGCCDESAAVGHSQSLDSPHGRRTHIQVPYCTSSQVYTYTAAESSPGDPGDHTCGITLCADKRQSYL